MQYTIWYSCYIDLLVGHGVGSCFIECDDKIQAYFVFKQNTTINELHLLAISLGLEKCPIGSDIHFLGPSKYPDQALKKLKTWIDKDEIDLKSHSHILKEIWNLLCQMKNTTSQYFLSRRADPMLWVTSQACANHFKIIQEMAIRDGKFLEFARFGISDQYSRESFLKSKFSRPLTETQFEKKVTERKAELLKVHLTVKSADNVIQFPQNLR